MQPIITSNALFLAVCALEILHAIVVGRDFIWFCEPHTVGWGWTIINFFLLGGIIYTRSIKSFKSQESQFRQPWQEIYEMLKSELKI